jgi:hypothetical protein
MQTFLSSLRPLACVALGAIVALVVGLQPAQAAEETYIAPDGSDLTAIVTCLPEQLTKADLQRAISEFGNDYLERVFTLKDDYSEYDRNAAEKEFESCLRRKGITPVVEKRQ